jgi:hypothetical protein
VVANVGGRVVEAAGPTATASTVHIGPFGERLRGMHFAGAGLTEMEQRSAAALAEV